MIDQSVFLDNKTLSMEDYYKFKDQEKTLEVTRFEEPKIQGRFRPIIVRNCDREKFNELRDNLIEIEAIYVDRLTGQTYFVEKEEEHDFII